jgi:hypothetical protein
VIGGAASPTRIAELAAIDAATATAATTLASDQVATVCTAASSRILRPPAAGSGFLLGAGCRGGVSARPLSQVEQGAEAAADISARTACVRITHGRLARVNLSAQAAADLHELLRVHGIRCWVMGGWGVDAPLGEQTREHHDLNVLVLAADLPTLGELIVDNGFAIKQVWEAENRWLDMDGRT